MKLVGTLFSLGMTALIFLFLDIPKFNRSKSRPRSPSDECWCTECEVHRARFKIPHSDSNRSDSTRTANPEYTEEST